MPGAPGSVRSNHSCCLLLKSAAAIVCQLPIVVFKVTHSSFGFLSEAYQFRQSRSRRQSPSTPQATRLQARKPSLQFLPRAWCPGGFFAVPRRFLIGAYVPAPRSALSRVYANQRREVHRDHRAGERRDASVLPLHCRVERCPVACYAVVARSAAKLNSLRFISFQGFTSLLWLWVVAKEKARRLSAPGPL